MTIFSIDDIDDEIAKGLLLLRYYIYLKNKYRGETDPNRKAEDFLAGLLNVVYNSDFFPCDRIKLNTKAIDISNADKTIAIQISSDSSYEKITETVEKFEEEDLPHNILIVLIIGEKLKYRKLNELQKAKQSKFKLEVYDIYDLISYIMNFTRSKKQLVSDYIKENLKSALKQVVEFEEGNVGTSMKNGNKLKSYFQKEIKDTTRLKLVMKGVKEFQSTLTDINEDTRKFLYFVMKNCKPKDIAIDNGIQVSYENTKRKWILLNSEDRLSHGQILEKYGFSVDVEEFEDVFSLAYCTEYSSDILADILVFCNKNKILKEVIIDLQFSLFDN